MPSEIKMTHKLRKSPGTKHQLTSEQKICHDNSAVYIANKFMKKASGQKKNTNIKLLVVTVLIFAVVFAGVVWVLSNQDKISRIWEAPPFTEKSAGLAVSVVLASEKAEKIIDSDGGKLEIPNAILDFPSRSLLTASDVAIYPIEKMNGLPNGAQFIAGAQIDSMEDVLLTPASLQVTIPDEAVGKNLRGVAYGKDGSNLHYFPVEISGNQANFLLFHFSGYGIIAVDDSEMKLPEPSLERLSAEFVIASIMQTYQDDFFWGRRDEMPLGAKESLLTAMEEWYRDGVKPKLMSAIRSDDLLLDSATEYIVWRQMAIALGIEEELAALDQEGINILARAIKSGGDKAYQKCVGDKDAEKAGRLLRIWALVEALGLNGKAGINWTDIQSKIEQCANFELRITSRFDEKNGCGGDSTIASGKLNLTPDNVLILSGEGEVKTTEQKMCGAVCLAKPGPEVSRVEVLGSQLAAANKTEIALLLKIFASDRVEYSCRPSENWTDLGTINLSHWLANMSEMHYEDLVEEEADYSTIKITDWEKVNKDGVFAKKHYKSTKSLGTTLVAEDTLFELMHAPR